MCFVAGYAGDLLVQKFSIKVLSYDNNGGTVPWRLDLIGLKGCKSSRFNLSIEVIDFHIFGIKQPQSKSKWRTSQAMHKQDCFPAAISLSYDLTKRCKKSPFSTFFGFMRTSLFNAIPAPNTLTHYFVRIF